MGCVPVQVPSVVVSVCPCTAVPERTGSPVFTGGAGMITPLAQVRALAWPAPFDAVTTAYSRLLTSADVSAYDWPVAPATFAHFQAASQRTHWYAYVIGVVPLQLPFEVVSVCPSLATPDSAGSAVFTGGTPATTALAQVRALAWPAPFDAVTTAYSRLPTSADVSAYDWPVAPATFAHFQAASQRTHWYAYVIGVVPLQLPFEVVSVCPSLATPDSAGSAVFSGG